MRLPHTMSRVSARGHKGVGFACEPEAMRHGKTNVALVEDPKGRQIELVHTGGSAGR